MNMVANFNLTWKASCLEILNYVSMSIAWFNISSQLLSSLRSVHQARS